MVGEGKLLLLITTGQGYRGKTNHEKSKKSQITSQLHSPGEEEDSEDFFSCISKENKETKEEEQVPGGGGVRFVTS